LYDPDSEEDVAMAVDGADLVLVHEWTAPPVISALSRMKKGSARFVLLFHDTHHRSLSRTREMEAFDLSGFDGVLAFGDVIRSWYDRRGWSGRTWTWHEAADTTVFYPRSAGDARGGVVWIGNWGDDERNAELTTYLMEPVQRLRLAGSVYGVRYPAEAVTALTRAGLRFHGRAPNHHVPAIYARHAVTVHVPRRPYTTALPGIPTIRVFEALACGIPLVSAPWQDVEGLFTAGEDFLMAHSGDEMRRNLRDLTNDRDYAAGLAVRGLRTIRERHTCAHRVDELMGVVASLGASAERSHAI
jgi:spore maturation protein CgeB